MQLLTQYRSDAAERQLESIHPAMLSYFPDAFPKAPTRWISHYRSASPTVRIEEDGFVHGGYARLLAHVFDFS